MILFDTPIRNLQMQLNIGNLLGGLGANVTI